MSLLSSIFLILLLSVCYSQRIYHKCQEIPMGSSRKSYCIDIDRNGDCGATGVLSSDNKVLVQRDFNLEVIPEICTDIDGAFCNACVKLRDLDFDQKSGDNSGCVDLVAVCKVGSPTSMQLGCFNESDLAANCKATSCLNDCSNNGVCQGDLTCKCDDGFSGKDCSTEDKNTWKQCTRTSDFSAPICIEAEVKGCKLEYEFSAGTREQRVPIAKKELEVKDFKNFFSKEKCAKRGPCDMCLKWKDYKLVDNQVSVCVDKITVNCLGNVYSPKMEQKCFTDDFAPECLAGMEDSSSEDGPQGHKNNDKNNDKKAPSKDTPIDWGMISILVAVIVCVPVAVLGSLFAWNKYQKQKLLRPFEPLPLQDQN